MPDKSDLKPIEEIKSEFERAVSDVADYLCSRDDTFRLRAEVEGRARGMLHGLSLKGWVLVPPKS